MSADFTPVELARAAAFTLGPVEVRPATCEVIAGAAREVLQPRIMQVLVALARRRGDVVSRDDLIRECWDGTAVGDDAIQRCIGRLRQAGEAHGAFEILNIARVGYRLIANETAAATTEPVLAVLPFENHSNDPELGFFSEGVSEEVQAAATRIKGVRVISRASSFQLRGTDKSLARAASDLKATHVLDGAVRRSGDRVRISAQLAETRAHTTIWSQTYERSLTDAFAIQDEIAAAVADALQRTFAAAPQAAIDPIALDCFLQARDRHRNSHARASDAVVALLDEAVSRAPDYAPAWALLARVREMNALDRNARGLPRSAGSPREAAERALALDPGCVSALISLAQLEPACGRFIERERLFLQARAAAPGDAEVMVATAYFLNSVGRCREALEIAKHAYEIDPLSVQVLQQYTMSLGYEGFLAEAIEVLDAALRQRPDSFVLLMNRVWLSAHGGDWSTVDNLLSGGRAAQLRESGPLAGRVIDSMPSLRNPTPEARAAWIATAERVLAETGSVRLGDITALARIGEADAAFALCARASFARFHAPVQSFDPFDIGPIELFLYERRFHHDPRFVDLCGQLGLIAYWAASGRWPDCAEAVAVSYDFKAACSAWAAAHA